MSDSDLTLHQPIVEEPTEAELWKQEIAHVTRQLSIIISAIEHLTELCRSIKEDAYSGGESEDEAEEPSARPVTAVRSAGPGSAERAVFRFAGPTGVRAGFSAAAEAKDPGMTEDASRSSVPRFFRFR